MPETRNLKLLVIEDREEDVALLLLHLKRKGFDTAYQRVDTEQGLKSALRLRKWDCVICDYSLPGFDAMEALAVVRSFDVDLPFIIVSGAIGEVAAVIAMKSGAHDYLMKDNLTRLVPAIERELHEAQIRRQAKSAEIALRESENRLQLALEGANDGIWDWNIQTGAAFFSSRWAEILGFSMYEVEHNIEFWKSRLHPDDRKAVMDALSAHLRNETSNFEVEYRIMTKSNDWKWLLTRGKVVDRDDTSVPIRAAGTTIDITVHKHLEEQLRQAQKMESLGLLAGGIAHDFNNLLTVILGHINLELTIAKQQEKPDQRQKASLEQVAIAADRAASLTRQLLAFSRKQVTKSEIVNPRRIVENLEPMLQRIIGEHIRLDITFHDEIGRIHADVGLIEQSIMNLVVNARDAMPDGGSMQIIVDTVLSNADPEIKGFSHPDQEMVRICVCDNGIGMKKSTVERIFEPFFTTKPLGKGTGLGLATVYGIVKQFNGHVAVQSKIGKGTKLTLFFPAVTQELSVKEERRSTKLISGDETILLCEDEEIVRNLMTIILEKAGYHVITAENAERAIQKAQQYASDIDILVTDVVMPDMNGSKLAGYITEAQGNLPVLFVSGYASDTIAGLEPADSKTEFLNKPFLPNELLERVRVLLDN